jgi:hypothetical protein
MYGKWKAIVVDSCRIEVLTMGKTLVACVIIGVTASAHASTFYDFAGTYTSLFPGPELGPVHFSLTTPGPVTVETMFVPGSALTCDACDRIIFYPDAVAAMLGPTPSSAIGYGVSGTGTFIFYFDPGSFTIDGSHASILLPGINEAVLNVQGAPEPSTTVPLLFLASGLAVLPPFRRRA